MDFREEIEAEQELEYRRRTAEAADQFWSEVSAYTEEHSITAEDAKLAIRMMCGTPGWEAVSVVWPEKAHLSVIDRKNIADEIYVREDIHELVKWAKVRSQELYALDISAWDWSFKDSELSLRLLIACSEEQLKKCNGIVSQTVANTILGAVRELNKMYEYDGTSFKAEQARAVIFLHDDQLED